MPQSHVMSFPSPCCPSLVGQQPDNQEWRSKGFMKKMVFRTWHMTWTQPQSSKNNKMGTQFKINTKSIKSLTFNSFFSFSNIIQMPCNYFQWVTFLNHFYPQNRLQGFRERPRFSENHEIKGVFLPKPIPGFILTCITIYNVHHEREILVSFSWLRGCNSISTAPDLTAPVLVLME